MAKIAVIGAGFSGISAAAYLASMNHEVHVFEKNAEAGGRARQFTTDGGYVFDMGPSWYWMPGVFESFFNDFGTTVSRQFDLRLLDPGFDMVFAGGEQLRIPADYESLRQLFESVEKGAGLQLDRFMRQAEVKYEEGINRMAQLPGLSLKEFADPSLFRSAWKLDLFTSFHKHVRRFFKDPRLVALMEFPIMFLGAMPREIPALYSLMNYAGLKLGTWYPMGGFGKVVQAMVQTAEQSGAIFHYRSNVEKVEVINNRVAALVVNGEIFECEALVASADYHHVEAEILPPQFRNYDEKYWNKRILAPSCLIFYVGLNKKIRNLQHHTLFFDEDLDKHSREIYKDPDWPSAPLFYACCPSKTDAAVAPEGHENLFLLMPIAPGLPDEEETRERYFGFMISKLENQTGETNLLQHVDYKRSYCVRDFISDYNSFRGNAYGLANTLRQTAVLKPRMQNRKLHNLFYAGQLTVPGPGVPPGIISGKIAAKQLEKFLKHQQYEITL